jgi:Transposase DDE domain
VNRAVQKKIVPKTVWAAVDSTALQTSHASEYFQFRRGRDGRPITIRNWPKMGLVIEPRSHLLLGMTAGRGLSYDYKLLRPLLEQALRHVQIDLVLADAGFDSEANHVIAREELGVRRTLINLNRRGNGPRIHGKYRGEMSRRFNRRTYGQRWQVESAVSQIKRRLGAVLNARTRQNQDREMLLKGLTQTIAIVH